MQIRTKLTVQFITIVAGILAFSLMIIYAKFRQITEEEFYDSLRSKALMTVEMVLHDEAHLTPLAIDSTHLNTLPFQENIAIYNEHFQRVFTFNRGAKEHPASTFSDWGNNAGEKRFVYENRLALGLRHRSHTGHAYFVIAESVFNAEDLAKLRNILIFTLLLGVGIVAATGWFFAGQAMAPVSRIVNQVDQILPTGLNARLDAPNSHDEIAHLVTTFNRLLDRIQVAFQMQKRFISNVSHELKNPLSVITSQLEVALQKKRQPEEYHETLNSVLEDTRNLNVVADKLLQLARVHSEGADIVFTDMRLDEALLQTREALLRQHPEYQISFDIEGMPENEDQLCVKGNEPLLRLAFLNLMDNGCKFSPDRRVDVKIYFHEDGHHCLEIVDKGPGIAQTDMPHIFQPFFRSTQSLQVRGSGIGLSLVDTILKLHRVALEVISSAGQGTTFRLVFPG